MCLGLHKISVSSWTNVFVSGCVTSATAVEEATTQLNLHSASTFLHHRKLLECLTYPLATQLKKYNNKFRGSCFFPLIYGNFQLQIDRKR